MHGERWWEVRAHTRSSGPSVLLKKSPVDRLFSICVDRCLAMIEAPVYTSSRAHTVKLQYLLLTMDKAREYGDNMLCLMIGYDDILENHDRYVIH